MNPINKNSRFFNFKFRKIIHYSLIISILLLQIILAIFFYNEFLNKKNIQFIENQIKTINSFDGLTNNATLELLNAQNGFQKYITTKEKKHLKSFFNAVNSLSKNIDSINQFIDKVPKFKKHLISKKNSLIEVNELKSKIDSTYQYSTSTNFNTPTTYNNAPQQLKKYEYNSENINIETKTFSDSIKKKGLFGRLKDAVTGKVDVLKDSTVVLMKNTKSPKESSTKIKFDSLANSMNNYYANQIKNVKVVNIIKDNHDSLYKTFNNLLFFSNTLINTYQFSIKESKLELEKELAKINSKSNKIRNYLFLTLTGLMFLISILIMYFTRLAFDYENKLNLANNLIKENLNFKNRILGMLSHEIRSPLKITSIFIKKIINKTTDENIKESLKSISFTNESLLIQANQILEYTKNQHVKNKITPSSFNLKEEIDTILNTLKPYIETRNNLFIINQNIDSNIIVNSDKTKIYQLFMNILGNANKFTENGEITVETNTKNLDENKISLITKISDTGVGILKSDIEKIFEPYYQGILSENIDNLGAGLGLSLCKEIIEIFSGNISIESEQNKGTSIFFNIVLNLHS